MAAGQLGGVAVAAQGGAYALDLVGGDGAVSYTHLDVYKRQRLVEGVRLFVERIRFAVEGLLLLLEGCV